MQTDVVERMALVRNGFVVDPGLGGRDVVEREYAFGMEHAGGAVR